MLTVFFYLDRNLDDVVWTIFDGIFVAFSIAFFFWGKDTVRVNFLKIMLIYFQIRYIEILDGISKYSLFSN